MLRSLDERAKCCAPLHPRHRRDLDFPFGLRSLNPFVGDNVTYIILFPVVAFVAWYCGVGPSIVTIVLALGGAMYWLIPRHSLHTPNPARSMGALAFLFASTVIVALGEARRRDSERLRNAQGELENRVRERTAELDVANHNLRGVSARLLQLQDEERRRIARELHDSIGQMLAALSMNLSGVRTDIERLTKTTAALTDSEDLAEVRHHRRQKAAKSFKISSGNRRVYTTFAI